jgi:hypothetical protein
MHKKVTRCQSDNQAATCALVRGGHVVESVISPSQSRRIALNWLMTTSMDWSCNPGRFSMGKSLERKSGEGLTGNPCVT